MMNTLFANGMSHNNLLAKNDNRLTLGPSWLNLDYQEPDKVGYGIPTGYLDREEGTVPGVRVVFSRANKHNVYYSLDGSYYNGKLTYGGYTQDLTPASFKSSHEFYTLNAGVGYVIPVNDELDAVPLITAGYRLWKRNITPEEREHYNNGFIGLGWKFDWNIIPRLIMSPSAAFGTTILSRIAVFDPPIQARMSLGNNLYCQLGLEINYLMSAALGVGVYVDYLSFDFGGNYNWQAGTYEPDSTTRQLTYGIQLSYLY
jgi:hypothetical protein